MNESMRIVFMGTPAFAQTALQALCENQYRPVAVYTQPDKVNRRGGKISFSPVKAYALEQGLAVLQPQTFRDEAAVEELRALAPDLIVVVAYGCILPPAVLSIPRFGAINIHASLLPRYRGAAPVQRAIIEQQEETGVTLMQLDEGMDTGPIVRQVRVPLAPDVTTEELMTILAEAGARELLQTLPVLPQALSEAIPQKEKDATYAQKLTKDMSRIDWSVDARAIHALVRGMYPNPGTYTFYKGKRLKIHRTCLPGSEGRGGHPGEIVSLENQALWVQTGRGLLCITALQPENHRQMKSADFVNGYQVELHDTLGE